MANTLTNLIPDLYAALDQVSREQVGYIPAVARNSTAERAAVGQAVYYPVSPEGNAEDISPAMQVPEPTDQTIGNGSISITKARVAEFGFVGENQLGLNSGPGYMTVQADMIAQAMRKLVNEVERDVSVAAAAGASRAFGTAGTTPFATNTAGVSQVRKILLDNGAPNADLQLVLDSTAGASLRTLYGINTDRDWSSLPMAEQGVLATPHGVSIRETGQPVEHEGGTVTDVTVTGANDVGDTVIGVTTGASTGAVSLTVGDVIQIAGDSESYVVAADVTITDDTTGNVTIQSPGLRKATAGSEEVSVLNTYNANVAFYRGAIQLVTRAPALPQEGDMAIDTMMLQDPRSGLAFEVRVYPGYRKVRYEIGLAWGVAVTQKRHTALLLG